MPTLDQWVAALSQERLVTLESSPALIADIQARQAAHDAALQAKGKQPQARKPQVTSAPNVPALSDIRVAPIHLLHRLGVVTTPAIPNLADICSTWAQYRYLWAFELPDGTPGDRLRLSLPARDIDFHQKGLMSDQIGVGMAALVMETLFSAPDATDVDVALSDPAWPIQLDSASPDYIFQPVDKSSQYVVECKGTRCGRSNAVEQLRRGLEQVPSLVFTDGRPSPTALVIGTQLTPDFTYVYIVDPPADPPGDGRSEEKPRRVDSREWRISNVPEFQKRVSAVAASKLISYALTDHASLELARSLRPEYAGPEPAPQPPVFRESDVGTFVGSIGLVRSVDAVDVQVFQGVEVTLRQHYIEGESAAVAEASRALGSRLARMGRRRETGYGFEQVQSDGAIVLRSIAIDGSMLEFRLTPR
jgi:hypothetical protein